MHVIKIMYIKYENRNTNVIYSFLFVPNSWLLGVSRLIILSFSYMIELLFHNLKDPVNVFVLLNRKTKKSQNTACKLLKCSTLTVREADKKTTREDTTKSS